MRSRLFVPLVILVTILSLFLNLFGIRWGLPNEERINLFFGSREAMESSIPDLEKVFLGEEGFQQIPEPTEEMERASPYLDVIRSYHSDEIYFLKYIANLDPAKGDFDPNIYKYGSLQVYLVAGLLKTAERAGYIRIRRDINYYITHPAEFARFYLTARLACAVMGTLAVLFIILAASNMFGRTTGLLSGAMLSVVPLWALHSHFGKVDIPSAFWLALTLFFASLLLKKWSWKWLLSSSIAAGLAFSTKYPAGIALLFVWLAVALAHRTEEVSRARKLREMAIALLFFFIAFFLTSPFIVLNAPKAVAAVVAEVFTQYGKNPGFKRFFSDALSSYRAHLGILNLLTGRIILGLTILGMVISFIRRRPADWVVIIPSLLFFLLVGAGKLPYPHYMLPLVPLLALLFGRGVGASFGAMRRRRIVPLALGLVVAAALIYAFLFSLAYDIVMSKRDIRKEASRWIAENLSPRAEIGMLKYPVIYRMPPIRRDLFKVTPASHMLVLPRYFILTSDQYRPGVHWAITSAGDYRLLKRFDVEVRLLGIRFPSLSERVGSGLGQIAPWIEVYERKELW